MKIKLKIRSKAVKIPTKGGGIISTTNSPPQYSKSMLNFAIVEVVEIF
jgi:hypothetical protein